MIAVCEMSMSTSEVIDRYKHKFNLRNMSYTFYRHNGDYLTLGQDVIESLETSALEAYLRTFGAVTSNRPALPPFYPDDISRQADIIEKWYEPNDKRFSYGV